MVKTIETSNGTTEDAELLRAFVSKGCEESFAVLVQKYLGMVLGITLRRTGQRCLAEEIAQSVFAILARKAPRLKIESTLSSWLYRTAMIECSEALRQ